MAKNKAGPPTLRVGGSLSRSKDDLGAWLVQHTADPRFQDAEVLGWFTSFFEAHRLNSEIGFIDQIKKHLFQDIITPSWNLVGTETGRINTTDPNLIGTPRNPEVRSLIVPSVSGDCFVIADYSFIELVIQAALANEPTMLNIIKNRKDIHIFLAAQIRQTSYNELMTLKTEDPARFKSIRNPMKAVNFGLIYGMGSRTLWKRLLNQNIPFEDAQRIYNTWKETFSQIATYQERCRSQYFSSSAPIPRLDDTHIITSVRGRPRRPDLYSNQRVLEATQLINYPIQATCSDFLKGSLRILYMLIKSNILPAQIVLSAHDEIVLQCSLSDREFVADMVRDTMISVAFTTLSSIGQSPPPVGVEIGMGESWADKP